MTARQQLSLHAGGVRIAYDALGKIKLPEKTESYSPISHQEVIDLVVERSEKLISGYTLKDQSFGVSPKSGENFGNRMFGVMTFNDDSSDMGLAIGVRNSYDQSLSVGVALGSKVFVCDNLMFVGDVVVARKHTGDIFNQLSLKIDSALSKAPQNHEQIRRDAELMREIPIEDSEAMMMMGLAYGKDILKPRQLLRARRCWEKPPQEDFEERNLWSLYNAFTEALKSSCPSTVMETHIEAHSLLMGEGLQKIGNLHETEYVRKVA